MCASETSLPSQGISYAAECRARESQPYTVIYENSVGYSALNLLAWAPTNCTRVELILPL